MGEDFSRIGRQGANQFSVGSGCFVIQLWWETHPSFVQVVSASKNCMAGSSKGREAVEERPHADYCGDLRERVVLVEVQRGVQNVSLHEGRQKGVGVDTTIVAIASSELGSVGRSKKWNTNLIPESRGE